MNKLLGRRPSLAPVVERALGSLRKLAEAQPELRELAATTAALLQRMYTGFPKLPFTFSSEEVKDKLEAGIPVLRGATVSLDGKLIQKQFGRLCGIMEAQGHPSAHQLGAAVQKGHFDVLVLAQAIFQGEPADIGAKADSQGLDAELAATLLRLTLLPLLEQISAATRPLRPADVWNHGYCPTCGAWPLLGEYRGLEQQRFLRCGLCGDDWALDRLLCFVCGSREHAELHYLEVAGEELKQRAHTCERCHSYIKQVSTLDRLDSPALLVADIATLHLDLIALERGYSTPT